MRSPLRGKEQGVDALRTCAVAALLREGTRRGAKNLSSALPEPSRGVRRPRRRKRVSLGTALVMLANEMRKEGRSVPVWVPDVDEDEEEEEEEEDLGNSDTGDINGDAGAAGVVDEVGAGILGGRMSDDSGNENSEDEQHHHQLGNGSGQGVVAPSAGLSRAAALPSDVWSRIVSMMDPVSRLSGIGSASRRLREIAASTPGVWHTVHPDPETSDMLTDTRFVPMVRYMSATRELDVSHCSQIGDPTLVAIAERCAWLESLNIQGCAAVTGTGLRLLSRSACASRLRSLTIGDHPSVTPASLARFITHCTGLSELRLVSVATDDPAFASLLARASSESGERPLGRLRQLRLDHCAPGEQGSAIATVLGMCGPGIERLAVSGPGCLTETTARGFAAHGGSLTSLGLAHLGVSATDAAIATAVAGLGSSARAGTDPVLREISVNWCVGAGPATVAAIVALGTANGHHRPGSSVVRTLQLAGNLAVDDAACERIGDAFPALAAVVVSGTSIGAEGIAALAGRCPGLRSIDAAECAAVDGARLAAAIAEAAPHNSIERLVLYGCPGVAAIDAIAEACPRLATIDVRRTRVSREHARNVGAAVGGNRLVIEV